MGEEKPDKEKKNLIARQKEKIIQTIVLKISETEPSLYYASTSKIARRVLKCIQDKEYINHRQFELVEGLRVDDIQVILSYK